MWALINGKLVEWQADYLTEKKIIEEIGSAIPSKSLIKIRLGVDVDVTDVDVGLYVSPRGEVFSLRHTTAYGVDDNTLVSGPITDVMSHVHISDEAIKSDAVYRNLDEALALLRSRHSGSHS